MIILYRLVRKELLILLLTLDNVLCDGSIIGEYLLKIIWLVLIVKIILIHYNLGQGLSLDLPDLLVVQRLDLLQLLLLDRTPDHHLVLADIGPRVGVLEGRDLMAGRLNPERGHHLWLGLVKVHLDLLDSIKILIVFLVFRLDL